jgi:hypothetical protein
MVFLPQKMNLSTHFERPDFDADETLLQLEMRIARRADQLAATRGNDRADATESWWEAEREVLAEARPDWKSQR